MTLAAGAGVDPVASLGDATAEEEGVAEDRAAAEDSGEADAAGVEEAEARGDACRAPVARGEAVAFGVAAAAALRTSFSSTPTRRSTLCLAISTVSSKVTPKKMQPRYTVALVRTVAVWAPKMFSVTPLPKAAPSPSFLGRCISTTSVSKIQTITRIPSRTGMKILNHIRAGICRPVCSL